MARNIEAFKEKIEITVENAQANRALQQTERHAQQLIGAFKGGLGALSPAAADGISKVDKLGGSFQSLASGPLRMAVGAFIGLAASITGTAAAIFGLVVKASEFGGKIKDMSEQTGLGAETISSLKFAADQSSGSIEQFGTGMKKFSMTVAEAARGSEEAEKKLTRLGVDPKKAILDLDGALGQALKTIAQTPSGVLRAERAADAFGTKLGSSLIPTIMSFGGNLDELRKRAKALGVTLNDEEAESLDAFGDALDTLKAQGAGLANQFALGVAPALTESMGDISTAAARNKDRMREWGKDVGDTIRGVRLAFESEEGQILGFFANIIVKSNLVLLALQRFRKAGEEAGETNPRFKTLPYDPKTGRPDRIRDISAELEDMEKEAAEKRRGRRKAEETDLQKAARLTQEYIDKINREVATINLENQAFFERRELRKEERVALELISKQYEKLSDAQKLSIQERAREVGNLERANKGKQLFAQLLEEEHRLTLTLLGVITPYDEAVNKLTDSLARHGVVMDANQKRQAKQVIHWRMELERLKEIEKEIATLGSGESDRDFSMPEEYEGPKLEEMAPPPEMKFKLKSEWQEMADTLRYTFDGAFDALFNDGWKGLMDHMKQTFKRTLAQMLSDLLASGISSALAGLLPAGTIGGAAQKKKGGFFSKLFGGGLFSSLLSMGLSFIPGVGGFLGLAKSIGGSAGGMTGGFGSGMGAGFGRASGGPVYRGRPYIVGEHRPELFVPAENGYVHPRVPSGGGGESSALLAVLSELRGEISRMRSMSPDHVVTMGARGLTRAMSRDASLVDDYGRSLNLA